MNLRIEVVEAVLRAQSGLRLDAPLRLLEVGCMFNAGEGMSTLVLARALAQHPAGGRLISIEYDPSHVEASRRLIEEREPGLLEHIEFRCGHSLALLGPACTELGEVDLALLDGGAHPEVCLQEFEIVAARLAPRGAVIVDDLQEIAPSAAYSPQRPFGKGTLILPLLVVGDYLRRRDSWRTANASPSGGTSPLPAAAALAALDPACQTFGAGGEFCVVGAKHRILVFGDPECVAVTRNVSQEPRPSKKRSSASFMRNVARRLGLTSG